MLKYELTQLSDLITPPYTSFTEPAINERSDVAFEGFLAPTLPPFGIFYANKFLDNSWSRTIVDNSEAFLIDGTFQPVFEPGINDLGTVVYAGTETGLLTDENGNLIFDQNNEPIIQLVLSTVEAGDGEQEPTILLESNLPFNLFSDPDINNSGTVAYFAGNLLNIPVDFPVPTEIRTLSEGEITTIASTDGIFSNFDAGIDVLGGDGPLAALDIALSINENDLVAFQAGLDSGGRGVFVGDGETTIQIASSKGNFDLFGSPTLNDLEEVAFLVQRNNGTRGIFINSYGRNELLVDDSGAFSLFSSEVALNNNGEVAFFAELDDGSAGIYTASEIGSKLVIAIGDELAGSVVTGLGLNQEALNDQGQVAFQATLENGNTAIFRASPVSEPTNNSDRLYGDLGNNYIDGDAGDDLIFGYRGDDTLFGDKGDDVLRGGAGKDILEGGKGRDTLIGGADTDVFKLAVGRGTDTIVDYVDGIDKFSLGSGLQFGELDILQQQDDTIIKLSSKDNILASLYDVDASAIDATDFI